jgi:hypothetical protein
VLAGTGRGGARIPSSGSRRRYRWATAHDSAECRTAHRPHTTATDAPDARQRAIARSNCAGHTPARPNPANRSEARNRPTDRFDEQVAGFHWWSASR